jgi:hypothetical protein
MLERVRHLHVVKYVGVVTSDARGFTAPVGYLMPLYDGTLYDLLTRRGPVTCPQLLDVARQVCGTKSGASMYAPPSHWVRVIFMSGD